ncbi:heavy metal-binding domain-containing protein [Sunxiuqinia indica]|uniref:heavy metal-binding domain-containing protein n=1 Tax=Sunxiuqinia indica TaxID=2692584 RepID=UPI0013583A97|nr:heavy metal-binding domain-containing protein [Sunxiuqinia indica]
MKTLRDFFTGGKEKEIVQDNGSTLVAGQQTRYICPMKCEGNKTYNAPGNCPDCNMKLVPVDSKGSHDHHKHNHGCC